MKQIILPNGPFNSQHFYSLHSLQFKFISPQFQTCLSQEPAIRGEKVPWPQTTPWGIPTPSTIHPAWLDIRHSKLWPSEGTKFGAACVPQKIKKCEQNLNFLNAMRVLCSPPLQDAPHKIIHFQDCPALCWEKRKAEHKYYNYTITSRVPKVLLLGNLTKLTYLFNNYAQELNIVLVIQYSYVSLSIKWKNYPTPNIFPVNQTQDNFLLYNVCSCNLLAYS